MQIRRRPPNPDVSVRSLTYRVRVPGEEPRNILERIVWAKEQEVDRRRQALSLQDLQKQVLSVAPPKDFLAALRHSDRSPALIAEIKKASPSRGVIREDFDPVAIAQAYAEGGATCLSVLTDEAFFQGNFEYLAQVRQAVDLPLLCKEFIIYPYQMYLARVMGADAVLLIAAVLGDNDLNYFVRIAHALGMQALVEVHTLEELDRVLAIEQVQIIGINNRNLETFQTHLAVTEALLEKRRDPMTERGILIVSESGIHTSDDRARVADAGAGAILVGESLMRQPELAPAIAQLYR
jgi:indole-3-glycerol phosphate synthase